MNARRRALTRLLSVSAAVALTVAGCSSVTTPTGAAAASASSGSPSGTTAAAATFTIKGYAFPALTARTGQKITLVDADAEPHTVTADDGSFDSGSFDSAAPGTLTAPTTPGTYKVHCKVHPTMHGTLTVT